MQHLFAGREQGGDLSVHNAKLPLPAVAATTTYRVRRSVGGWLVCLGRCAFFLPNAGNSFVSSFVLPLFLSHGGASTESVSRPQKEAQPLSCALPRPGLGAAAAGGSVPIVGVCAESARGVSLHCPRVSAVGIAEL